MFDTDDGDAQNEGEQNHGRHDVVRQGIEWVRGNVQVDEVERGSPLDEARAEKRRALNRGKRQGDQECERERHEPQAANHRRGSQAQRPELGPPERAEAGDDRDGDVGQHHHLEQLDETVSRPLQRRGPLAEEQSGEDAQREPGEDLSRERHESGGWGTARKPPSRHRRRPWQSLPQYRDSKSHSRHTVIGDASPSRLPLDAPEGLVRLVIVRLQADQHGPAKAGHHVRGTHENARVFDVWS